MKLLYFLLGSAILIGMCQEDAAVSLTACACAFGMYFFLKKQPTTKNK